MKRKYELKVYYISISISCLVAQLLPALLHFAIKILIRINNKKVDDFPWAICLLGWASIFQQLIHIISTYIIVNFKSTDDLIQGVSKLDHILKVSVF